MKPDFGYTCDAWPDLKIVLSYDEYNPRTPVDWVRLLKNEDARVENEIVEVHGFDVAIAHVSNYVLSMHTVYSVPVRVQQKQDSSLKTIYIYQSLG